MTAPYCPWVSITPLMTASILSMVVHSLINGSPHMSMGCPCLINQKSVLSIVLSSLINDFLGIYVHVSLMSCTASGVRQASGVLFNNSFLERIWKDGKATGVLLVNLLIVDQRFVT